MNAPKTLALTNKTDIILFKYILNATYNMKHINIKNLLSRLSSDVYIYYHVYNKI